MKSSTFIFVMTLACAPGGHCVAAIDRAREIQQVALWTGELEEALSLPPDEKFGKLWLGLRNMGYRVANMPDRSPEVTAIYERLQKEFIAIPGHAEYFAKLIEKERAELQPGEYRGSYDRRRYWFLCETLRHLPSPETVLVLGRYLEDDRDTYPPPPPGSDSGVDPPSSIIAMESLMLLGLRDAPYPPGRWYWYLSTKELEVVRQWFAPIKSGEKPFSFKGQAVEYRFNPDGTWTTTPIENPPDDAPKPVPRVDPPPPAKPGPPSIATPPPPPAKPPGLPWPWLAAGVLLLIAALARLVVLRGRRAG